MSSLCLRVGIKTDPIEYRFSYEWLFRLLAQEEIHYVQLGTFFELFQLPDGYFVRLRHKAEDFGIHISSVFSAHREFGGFFREDPVWHEVAHRSLERLIDVGALLGADSVGSNAGSVMRDQMRAKEAGIRRFLEHMKKLMEYAHRQGLPRLTVEPMSCQAEPPTLPSEIKAMAEELLVYHREHPDTTSSIGYCADVAHGYADRQGKVQWNNLDLLQVCLPYLSELHLKNTNRRFEAAFGFAPEERSRGIIHIERIRDFLLQHSDEIPVAEMIGYLEIDGPKLGRDYSDFKLESQIRESLRYLKNTFETSPKPQPAPSVRSVDILDSMEKTDGSPASIQIAPSIMCADLCRIEEEIRQLETVGIDLLHVDLMDAHFVPNMPLGLEIIRQLRHRTDLPFDVHLMVENNDFFINELIPIGVQQISIHAESAGHLMQTLERIREHGIYGGVALKPSTPVSVLADILGHLDFVLIMAVNPGFAGQKMIPSMFQKIAECRSFLNDHELNLPIEVDGNVSFENIPKMIASGANILVGGTSSVFYKGGSLLNNMQRVREGIAKGLKERNTIT